MLTLTYSADILVLLHGVLRTLCRGLPQYLAEAHPWRQSTDARFLAALGRLIADQRHYAGRTAEAIAGRGGRPDPGTFPLEYASINDLSLDFMKDKIIAQLHEDYATLTGAARRLADQRDLHELVEEIVGNYRGHLEMLEEGGRRKAEGG
ncbi:MAG: hypothetical protein IT426_00480 [Pirellulales bacterium]|nr:hypothetical protein [Pirellulales bacterium]